MPGGAIVANQLPGDSKPSVVFDPIATLLDRYFQTSGTVAASHCQNVGKEQGKRASPMFFPIKMGWALRWQERSVFFVVSVEAGRSTQHP